MTNNSLSFQTIFQSWQLLTISLTTVFCLTFSVSIFILSDGSVSGQFANKIVPHNNISLSDNSESKEIFANSPKKLINNKAFALEDNSQIDEVSSNAIVVSEDKIEKVISRTQQSQTSSIEDGSNNSIIGTQIRRIPSIQPTQPILVSGSSASSASQNRNTNQTNTNRINRNVNSNSTSNITTVTSTNISSNRSSLTSNNEASANSEIDTQEIDLSQVTGDPEGYRAQQQAELRRRACAEATLYNNTSKKEFARVILSEIGCNI